MFWFIFIVFFTVVGLLLRHIIRLRRLIRELDGAVRSERRLLSEHSANSLQKLGAFELVESINALIESHKHTSAQKTGYSSQIEVMLGAVQEAIVIFSEDRVVEYANPSAEKLFRNGQSIVGLRLEGVFRSLALLELLDSASQVEETESKQINIELGPETLWFEATCTRVVGLEPEGATSMLLVLHDITKLKALEVMRREFVANVSHELRTPLTIIKGFAETLIDDEATINAKSRLRFTTKILNNAERLHVLVEDLLTISRLESRPEQIELIEQPIEQLLVEAVENYRNRIDPNQQQVELKIDPGIQTLRFDRYRINQVLDNLVENVFRYAPNFTKLSILAEIEKDAGQVRCSVVDDGPGIPEKDLPHLFERFYCVDKGRSRETGGTGLGLSIVKHIIQLHGGSVNAQSKTGEGTIMSFTLPIPSEAN
jgi:signal transduction histidine kinase